MSRRFAVAVALIAGLLGMHGFTSNHGSMPPPATDDMAAHSATKEAAAAAPMAMAAAGADDVMVTGAAVANAAATSMTSLTGGSGHAMGALCLAILTGLGWLLLALLLGRRGRLPRPNAGHLHAHARAAEPVPPSLSELCVLRT